MKINKEYTPIAEGLSKLANMSFKSGEDDIGELLALVYTCYLVGLEKDLLEMLKSYQDLDDWGKHDYK